MLSVLGPLHLEGAAGPIGIVGRKSREVLTLLALAAPRPMSVGALASRLWDEPPPSAVKTVQGHVSRVRTALTAAGIGTVAGGQAGYHLAVADGQLDVAEVERLRRGARLASLAGDDPGAAGMLAEARALWRGEPELPAGFVGDAERARLVEEHLGLVEDHLAAVVAAGGAASVIGELEALTAEHSLRERLWELRMTALYHCGRQADALRAYRDVRRLLGEQLGVDPGPGLRGLERAVLGHTVVLPGAGAPAAVTATVVVDGPRYANAAGVHVAYSIFGDGDLDVLLLNATFVPLDSYLEEPHLAGAIARLATGRRVVAFDRRGIGQSDPVSPHMPPSIEGWRDDVVAVLDAVGAGSVHVFANADTSMIALLLAATNPERVRSVTMVNGFARFTVTADYLHGEQPRSVDNTFKEIRSPIEASDIDVLALTAPTVAADPRFRAWWDAAGRRGASPRTAELLHEVWLAADVRTVLPDVTPPVLLISRAGSPLYDTGHARYLAERLPDARLVEYADSDGPWFLGDVERVVSEFERFSQAS
ncbi:alpha/beta fold hydrolase [Pseudonocardia sp. TRM90224]|uniref:alpha/beta fold hydrolase n=1 Tax=Pseudonocardia sp. TRM90224 TaxID=2812678 RepID=UPI001E37B07C|nr:alpha/beta fold hydrolase [Pseudonocardia sp. TRM90224]